LSGYATALLFSADGRRVAAAGHFEQIRIWEDKGGKKFARLLDLGSKGQGAQAGADPAVVTALAFSPDGRFVASASSDDKVAVWDIQAPGKPIMSRDAGRPLAAEPIKWLSLLQPSAGTTMLVMTWTDGTTRRFTVTPNR
jgi:WD40 repeat protein